MGWFKDLMGKLKGKGSEVKIVTGDASRPGGGEKKPAIKVAKLLEGVFKKFLVRRRTPSSCIFFDPEETECFIYELCDKGALEFDKISIRDWGQNLPALKSLNNRLISLDDSTYGCVVSIFLTNLGERSAVLLFEGKIPEGEALKEEKRKAIRRINRFKPATALTHRNIDHLVQMIKLRREHTSGDIFQMLEEEEVFKPGGIEKFKVGREFKSLLSMPVPRKPLVKTLARWLGAEYVDVELSDIDEKLAMRVPQEQAKTCNALAFKRDGVNIKVAFWNPFDEEAVSKIGESLGEKIIPVMSCEEDIRYELEKLYSAED